MSALTKIIKGLAPNRHTVKSYNDMGDLDLLSDDAKVAHLLRGRVGYMASQRGRVRPRVRDEMLEYIRLNRSKPVSESEEEYRMMYLQDQIHDAAEGAGRRDIVTPIEAHPTTLDRPLYVTRAEGAFTGDFSGTPPGELHSTLVVDPENIKSYQGSYEGPIPSKMYRIDPGDQVFHPSDLADTNEALVSRGTLNKSKSMNEKEYIEQLLKGTAPFGLAGIAAMGASDNATAAQSVADRMLQGTPNHDTGRIVPPKSDIANFLGHKLKRLDTPLGNPLDATADYLLNLGTNNPDQILNAAGDYNDPLAILQMLRGK